MNKQVVTICLLFVLFFNAGCKKNDLPIASKEFSSIDELAKETVHHLASGDAKSLARMVVQKHEYVEKYHPYLPETKQGITLPAEEFFYTFIHLSRSAAIIKNAKKYKGNIVSLVAVKEPEKVIPTEKFTMLRRIPLVLVVKDKEGKTMQITDRRILGVVIEEKRKYRLLNVFD